MSRLTTASFPRDPSSITGNLRGELINCVRRAVTPERKDLIVEMINIALKAMEDAPEASVSAPKEETIPVKAKPKRKKKTPQKPVEAVSEAPEEVQPSEESEGDE